jgi:hypothetical protein
MTIKGKGFDPNGGGFTSLVINGEEVPCEVIESLRQQLAECQAREKVRIDALRSRPDYPCADKEYGDWCAIAFKAEYLPSDSTALDEAIKQAKREVLLEAEGKFWCYDNVNDVQSELRRMAEELK